MTEKEMADAICRLLLSLVAIIRRRYDLPTYHGMTFVLIDGNNVTATPPLQYNTLSENTS